MVAQMKSMEDENRRLKKMYAELSMQNDLLNSPPFVRAEMKSRSISVMTAYIWSMALSALGRFAMGIITRFVLHQGRDPSHLSPQPV